MRCASTFKPEQWTQLRCQKEEDHDGLHEFCGDWEWSESTLNDAPAVRDPRGAEIKCANCGKLASFIINGRALCYECKIA